MLREIEVRTERRTQMLEITAAVRDARSVTPETPPRGPLDPAHDRRR